MTRDQPFKRRGGAGRKAPTIAAHAHARFSGKASRDSVRDERMGATTTSPENGSPLNESPACSHTDACACDSRERVRLERVPMTRQQRSVFYRGIAAERREVCDSRAPQKRSWSNEEVLATVKARDPPRSEIPQSVRPSRWTTFSV